MQFGVRLGYMGPRQPVRSRNVASAFVHLEVIDHELFKQCATGRLLGPFPTPPQVFVPSPRKAAIKWRMNLHLSAPAGRSINDFIPRDTFSLQYVSVDDTVRMLICLGRGTRMAKVDLKSAFRMVPIDPLDWELLSMRW